MNRSTLKGLAEGVREGSTLAQDLVARSLERIRRAGGVNAVTALRATSALAEAEQLDQSIRQGHDGGPLAGLPFLVKDVEDAEGLPTTFASLLHSSAEPAPKNGLMAARLCAAGAIVIGKANTSELAMEGYAANPLYGVTRNPWAMDWSPGGSSGGSAAAIAAGLVPIATGTDIGGSVRCPASFCGLAGLKPTNGLIGRDAILPSRDFNNHGLFGTTVADVIHLLEVVGGPTAGDIGCLPSDRLPANYQRKPGRIVAAAGMFPGMPIEQEVEELFEKALAMLDQAMPGKVERIALSDVFPLGYDPDDFGKILGPEIVHEIGASTIESSAALFDPPVLDLLRKAMTVSFEDHLAARKRRISYTAQLDEFLGDDTVFLSPTMMVDGWLAEGRLKDSDHRGIPGWAYNTEPPNLTGHPALSVPAGRHTNGVPFGLQIVGPRFADDLVLGFGLTWEELSPWALTAVGYPAFGDTTDTDD